jgi:hypothetical protein
VLPHWISSYPIGELPGACGALQPHFSFHGQEHRQDHAFEYWCFAYHLHASDRASWLHSPILAVNRAQRWPNDVGIHQLLNISFCSGCLHTSTQPTNSTAPVSDIMEKLKKVLWGLGQRPLAAPHFADLIWQRTRSWLRRQAHVWRRRHETHHWQSSGRRRSETPSQTIRRGHCCGCGGADEAAKHHRPHKLTKEPPAGQGHSGDAARPTYTNYAAQENHHPVDTLLQPHSMTLTSTWELPVRRAGEHTKRGTHCEDHRLTKEPPSGGICSGDSATLPMRAMRFKRIVTRKLKPSLEDMLRQIQNTKVPKTDDF